MNHTTAQGSAAERLADVLERENAALQRLDLSAATALMAEKEAAAQLLSAERHASAEPEDSDTAARLLRLTQQNHGLLERAILVQARVIEIVAQAYQPPPELRPYGPTGGQIASRHSGVAYSTRV
jgi:hypothetical protein